MRRQRPPDDRLVGFYTREYPESARLQRPSNRLEFVRTQQLLRDRLPAPPARILDVGGGTGVHARWLAADGYDVTLVDVVPDHVRAAREVSATLPRPFTARVGDARSLDAENAGVDACLLLGPLYHLPHASDRAAALGEAVRVTRPGGLVCAAAISRFAFALYELRDGGDLAPERAARIARTMATGRGDPVGGLPDAFSHRPSDLAAELRDAGLVDVEILGVEGPGWPLFTPDLPEDRVERLLPAAIGAARLCDGHREMTAASAHLLAVGRRT
jgi:SAM-dependent methyltransferase